MSDVTINLTKWYHFVISLSVFVGAMSGALYWVDKRYVHTTTYNLTAEKAAIALTASNREREAAAQAAYEQSINLQYMIVQGRLEAYEHMIHEGIELTSEQVINHRDYIKQYEFLRGERNRLLSGFPSP